MGLHPVEFSTLPFLFHLHATWSSGSWALILTNYHCMVSRKFRSRSWTFFASAPPTLWPGSQLLSNGGDLQGLLHPEFSVSKLCVLTGFILTAFQHLPGYYLLLWFLSLRRNFFPSQSKRWRSWCFYWVAGIRHWRQGGWLFLIATYPLMMTCPLLLYVPAVFSSFSFFQQIHLSALFVI